MPDSSGELKRRRCGRRITILKIDDRKLSASSAGMPPLLIYRHASSELLEYNFQGMPLGGLANFPYEEKKISLFRGDKIITMSDGFPERQNPAGEMLDYPRAYQIISEAAETSPQEIVDILVQKSDDWGAGRPQDDDVTFVVIDIK